MIYENCPQSLLESLSLVVGLEERVEPISLVQRSIDSPLEKTPDIAEVRRGSLVHQIRFSNISWW
jgi:hypothetical protein